jgi:hypothetical protein
MKMNSFYQLSSTVILSALLLVTVEWEASLGQPYAPLAAVCVTPIDNFWTTIFMKLSRKIMPFEAT